MADTVKYLVTVDGETGEVSKVEQMGDAGELTEVPASTFEMAPAAAGCPSYVVNIFMGGEGLYTMTAAPPEGRLAMARPVGVPNPGGRRAPVGVPSPGGRRAPAGVPNPGGSPPPTDVADPDES